MQLEITPKRWCLLFQGERRIAVKIRGVVPGEKGGMLGGRSAVEWNGRKYMFMNWKIPERVVSNDGSARASTRASAASKLSVQSEQLPKIPDLVNSTPVPTPAKTITPTKSATPRLPAKLLVRGPAQEAIRHSLDPQLQRKAEQLLESAAPCERRAIEKAVLAAQRAGKQGPGQPRKTYKADAKTAVNRWLDDATDEERALALEFFQTASASKMMGDSADKKKRLNQVLSQLESGQAHGVSQSHPGHPMKSDRKGLKTIQLYPSEERRNRWQHTTWHHMPDYRDTDRVNNRTAIYIDSQKSIPRHYTIHPDWGM
ncbi:uncharacterized protein LOC135501832 isoform X2 [Lineus longissimus]|uniref:uncharacterized protein LOC135501832 isoform X2 n=1 Tax=Lineus longissimus TaxID=88925 RepID=UPI002B4E3B92